MYQINRDPDHILDDIRLFVLDMDGTVYLGEQWIDGAKDFLQAVCDSGRDYIFLTNNSSKNPAAYVDKLNRMGLSVSEDKIITSGQATVHYLKKHFPGKRVFLLGNDLLKAEFEESDIPLTKDRAEVIVTAFDTSLDYEKMCIACDYVRAGLPYISTHPDYNCPTETGFIPDVGAIHAFIHASAFRHPDRIIGKPYADIVEYLLKRVRLNGGQVLMVGDRLYTDVAAAVNNGLHSALVLSGETSLSDLTLSIVQPELIFDSVRQFIPLLKKLPKK